MAKRRDGPNGWTARRQFDTAKALAIIRHSGQQPGTLGALNRSGII